MRQLETDYLVVGAGAMGMAFADEILMRDSSVRVVAKIPVGVVS